MKYQNIFSPATCQKIKNLINSRVGVEIRENEFGKDSERFKKLPSRGLTKASFIRSAFEIFASIFWQARKNATRQTH